MRYMKQSNSEHLAVSLPTKYTRIEGATAVSKTKQDDLRCGVDTVYVMSQDLHYYHFSPSLRPSGHDSCDEQVVMEALLSHDARQQIDIPDDQVTL